MIPDEQPAPDPVSPWDAVRAACPDAILVRVIDVERRVQFWIAIARSTKNLELGAEIHDGATVVLPGRREDAERDALIAEFDVLYQKQQCPSTSPTTGASA